VEFMRNKASVLILAITLVGHLLPRVADAQQPSGQLDEVLGNLASDVPPLRIQGLEELLSLVVKRAEPYNVSTQATALVQKFPADADRIKRGLIAALEKENLRHRPARPGSLSETDGEYYADLIAAVGALSDARAAHALAGAIMTGGMAFDGLAALGAEAVPALLENLEVDPLWRAVPYVVDRIIRRGDDLAIAAVRSGLLTALEHRNPSVRIAALPALTRFSESEVTRAVTALADDDPFVEVRDGKNVFPVRIAAQTWLRERTKR
jgi:hypothetical protein